MKNKKKNIITIVFLIIIIAGIVISFLLLNNDKNKEDTTTTTTTNTSILTTTENLTLDIETTTPSTDETTTITTTSNSKTTTKKATTKKTNTAETTTTISSNYQDIREVTNLISQENKYGTIIKTYETIYYYTLSNGNEVEFARTSENKFDYSGYSGTTAGLLSDAKSLASENSSKYTEVLNIVNGYRSEVGASALTIDQNLNIAATIRAMEMGYSNEYSHTRPNGSDCTTILNELNISWYLAGENIAYGQKTPSVVCNDWYNSPGHRANMLNTNFTKIGVGYFNFYGITYWVQIFT